MEYQLKEPNELKEDELAYVPMYVDGNLMPVLTHFDGKEINVITEDYDKSVIESATKRLKEQPPEGTSMQDFSIQMKAKSFKRSSKTYSGNKNFAVLGRK